MSNSSFKQFILAPFLGNSVVTLRSLYLKRRCASMAKCLFSLPSKSSRHLSVTRQNPQHYASWTPRPRCILRREARCASDPPAKQQQSSSPSTGAQEVSRMLRLAVPALGIVLADPLQTLVDAASVGRISTLHLAALGPNTAIFNGVFQLLSFVGIATANAVASSASSSSENEQTKASRQTGSTAVSNSIVLALALGTLATAILSAFGPSWIVAMGTHADCVPLAIQYLSIRAFAMPAVLVTNACQGACLGQQDTVTPMAVAGAATLVSFLGNVYLVWGRHMGVAGAAIATVTAQYLATALILWRMWVKGRRPHGVPLRWAGVPRLASMREFFDVAVTLVARTAVGMAAYFGMAVAATRLGTVSVAAHQVAMQLFWFLSFFPEPLSMAAQSLIAREGARSSAARSLAWTLLRSGAGLGVILAAVVAAAFQLMPAIFTPDPAVQTAVHALAPLGALAMAVCGVMMVFDGISIGSGSFRHLPPSVGAGMVATLATLWFGASQGGGLEGVWWALVVFYAMRLAGHLVFYGTAWKTTVFAGDNAKPGGGGEHAI